MISDVNGFYIQAYVWIWLPQGNFLSFIVMDTQINSNPIVPLEA